MRPVQRCAECDVSLRKAASLTVKATRAPQPQGIAKFGWCMVCANKLVPGTPINWVCLLIDRTARNDATFIESNSTTDAVARLFERKPTAIKWVSR